MEEIRASLLVDEEGRYSISFPPDLEVGEYHFVIDRADLTKPQTPSIWGGLKFFSEICHQAALRKGWYDDQEDSDSYVPPNMAEKVALMHSELSEAVEEWRRNRMTIWYSKDKDGNDKPEGFDVELADTLIRIFDTAGYLKLDLQRAFDEKMAYNEDRKYRHGDLRA